MAKGIQLTTRQKRALRASGALVLPVEGLASAPTATYYDQYGEAKPNLPADRLSQSLYLRKGWSLTKPRRPKKRPVTELVGVADWDGTRQSIPQDDELAAVAVATYYTAAGTPLPNLPADPESMAKYLASGLSLDPPDALTSADGGSASNVEPTPISARKRRGA